MRELGLLSRPGAGDGCLRLQSAFFLAFLPVFAAVASADDDAVKTTRSLASIPSGGIESALSWEDCAGSCLRDFAFELSTLVGRDLTVGNVGEKMQTFDKADRQEICRHYFDHNHCLLHCTEAVNGTEIDERLVNVDHLCIATLSDVEDGYRCIETHHADVERACVAFMDAAVKQLSADVPDEEQMCKHLKTHLRCLVGNMEYNCGSLTELIFNKENIEKYFDNFIKEEKSRLIYREEFARCYDAKVPRDAAYAVSPSSKTVSDDPANCVAHSYANVAVSAALSAVYVCYMLL